MHRLTLAGALFAAAACSTTSEPAGRGPSSKEAVSAGEPADAEAATFLAAQVARLAPLDLAVNRAWWEASITGTDEAFAVSRVAEDALNAFYSDRDLFAALTALRGRPIADPLLKRQLDVLYLSMLGKQVPPELLSRITALEKEVEQAFNTYRGRMGGEQATQNRINEVLRSSKDSGALREAWEAQKGVGALVAPKLAELVGLRNEVARALGFRDYYALKIAESEQDEQELLALFDELDRLTREPFLKAKAELDQRLAVRLGIPADQLMPWHYQNPFFQEVPQVFDTGLDAAYRKQDTLALSRKFFGGIGLEVEPIIARSDLYEKEGKSPHAFSADIDRQGDVRVLVNIVPGLEWQSTMAHELGHAVYDTYIDSKLPWLLRKASHPLTTEGIAMMLEALVENPHWAERLGVIDPKTRDKALAEARLRMALEPLVFSRWTQVMLRFERDMYRDPSQDLNALWWDLVEKYQGLKRPPERDVPDYASKIHLVIVPVYYHNYMMGSLFASQVHAAIAGEAADLSTEVYVGESRVGELLKTRIFAPGALYPWNELTSRVTGKPLSPEAFAKRFEKL